jgi:hypothetical protein
LIEETARLDEDAALEYPQSGERTRGRRNITEYDKPLKTCNMPTAANGCQTGTCEGFNPTLSVKSSESIG